MLQRNEKQKIRQGGPQRKPGGAVLIIHRRVREGFTLKVMFEQKPEGRERASPADVWAKSLPGREIRNAKTSR